MGTTQVSGSDSFISDFNSQRDEAVNLLTHIFRLAEYGDYVAMNKIFDVEVRATTTLMLIARLRYSFKFRDNLDSWHFFRDNVRNELLNRNLDALAILRGLY